MLKKIITWAIVIFIIFYIATEPSGAAGIVHSIYNGLHSAATKHGRVRELAVADETAHPRAPPTALQLTGICYLNEQQVIHPCGGIRPC